MESIVDDVEDERENEGHPADGKRNEDSGWWDEMTSSFSVKHGDGLSSHGLQKGHYCQTAAKNHRE